MDFKDFCNTKESLTSNEENNKNNINKNIVSEKVDEKINTKSLEEKFEEYSSLNETELMQEFLKESVKAKQSGLYDDNKIDEIKSTLFPYLNEEQKKYFDKLMGMVK